MARPTISKAILVSLVGIMVLGLTSCGSIFGGGDETAGSGIKRKKELEDFQHSKTDVVYGEVGTDTEGMIVGGRRSQYEGKRQVVFGGDYASKKFDTKGYKSNSWNGSKDYGRKTFSGNTDASRYQIASAMGGEAARDSGRQSIYGGQSVTTSRFGTSSAREANAAAVNRSTNVRANDRFPMPRIMSERDYQKMTIQETNSLLGRDQ